MFEAVVLDSLKRYLSPVVIIGALGTFRGVFFLMPLAIALLFAGHEVWIKVRPHPAQ